MPNSMQGDKRDLEERIEYEIHMKRPVDCGDWRFFVSTADYDTAISLHNNVHKKWPNVYNTRLVEVKTTQKVLHER